MTKYVALRSRNFGEYAVLSLRNVARATFERAGEVTN